MSGGSGSGGSGGPTDPETQKYLTAFGLAVFAAALTVGLNSMNYKEITWKEFVNNYLARGSVERLVVVNNKWVKVGHFLIRLDFLAKL
jgi:AFG3 family protein